MEYCRLFERSRLLDALSKTVNAFDPNFSRDVVPRRLSSRLKRSTFSHCYFEYPVTDLCADGGQTFRVLLIAVLNVYINTGLTTMNHIVARTFTFTVPVAPLSAYSSQLLVLQYWRKLGFSRRTVNICMYIVAIAPSPLSIQSRSLSYFIPKLLRNMNHSPNLHEGFFCPPKALYLIWHPLRQGELIAGSWLDPYIPSTPRRWRI